MDLMVGDSVFWDEEEEWEVRNISETILPSGARKVSLELVMNWEEEDESLLNRPTEIIAEPIPMNPKGLPPLSINPYAGFTVATEKSDD